MIKTCQNTYIKLNYQMIDKLEIIQAKNVLSRQYQFSVEFALSYKINSGLCKKALKKNLSTAIKV